MNEPSPHEASTTMMTPEQARQSANQIRGEGPRRKVMAHTPPSNINEIIDTIIFYVDTIRDTDPGCKEALALIARHVWNRQHKIKAAT